VILQDHHHPLMCVISHISISNLRILITNWAEGLLIISQSLALTKQLWIWLSMKYALHRRNLMIGMTIKCASWNTVPHKYRVV
jgi:hypothetical protein